MNDTRGIDPDLLSPTGANDLVPWNNPPTSRPESSPDEMQGANFDDMKKPTKSVVDKDFTWGRISLGSFDDTVQWDDVKLYGQTVKPPVE